VLAPEANAIMVGDNPDTITNRALISDLVNRAGWPAIYPFTEFVETGGLMAYSYDLMDLFERRCRRRSRHSRRRQSRRHPVLPDHQIRAVAQPENNEGIVTQCAGDAARGGRRGGRVRRGDLLSVLGGATVASRGACAAGRDAGGWRARSASNCRKRC
jgi:hypothetical protein